MAKAFAQRSLADLPTGCIPTYTGKTVNPLALRPEDICIEDIAHHLSMLCRWTGAMREFYSVAEHSIRVSYTVPPQDALWGLLHDAPEAYLGDLGRVLRSDPVLGARYDELEERAMDAIVAAFPLARRMPDSVRFADDHEAARECQALWRPLVWGRSDRVETMPPGQAALEFLNRYRELTEDAP